MKAGKGGAARVPATIDDYIAAFPADIQARLRAVRATVRKVAPRAEERISYRMPALFLNGVVVYFAAFQKHIGLFPPVADAALNARVARYAGPKGNLQFPHDQPLPHALIAAVARARVRANAAKAKSKPPASRARKTTRKTNAAGR